MGRRTNSLLTSLMLLGLLLVSSPNAPLPGGGAGLGLRRDRPGAGGDAGRRNEVGRLSSWAATCRCRRACGRCGSAHGQSRLFGRCAGSHPPLAHATGLGAAAGLAPVQLVAFNAPEQPTTISRRAWRPASSPACWAGKPGACCVKPNRPWRGSVNGYEGERRATPIYLLRFADKRHGWVLGASSLFGGGLAAAGAAGSAAADQPVGLFERAADRPDGGTGGRRGLHSAAAVSQHGGAGR